MRVEFYKDDKDEWRWRIIATNGNILADSGEGYKNRLDCIEMHAKVTNQGKITDTLISLRGVISNLT